MNREIKFRAWNWDVMSRSFDFWDLSYEWFPNICLDDTEEEIMPHIVFMQYTWLKDKNWVEIYEGDILKIYYRTTVINSFWKVSKWDIKELIANVVFEPWMVLLENNNKWKIVWWHLVTFMNKNEVEVIWNIYENPELLSK